MHAIPCLVFKTTDCVISQLHYAVFIVFKPGFLHTHWKCCLSSFHSATVYLSTHLRQQEQLLSKRKMEARVNATRSAICSMLDLLFQFEQIEGATPEEQAFYKQCGVYLKEAMEEVEKCWPFYCNQQCKVPDECLEYVRLEMKTKITVLKKQLYASEITPEPAALLLETFSDFVAGKHRQLATINHVRYMEKLLSAAMELSGGELPTNEKLCLLLIKLNFNRNAFIEYCCEEVRREIEKMTLVDDKIHQLELWCNDIAVYIAHERNGLYRNRLSAARGVLNGMFYLWLHWKAVKQKEKPSAGEQQQKGASAFEVENIRYMESGAVVATFYDMIHESSFTSGARAALLRNVAKNGELPNTKNPSATYLDKEAKKNNEAAKETLLLHYLPQWYRYLGGKGDML